MKTFLRIRVPDDVARMLGRLHPQVKRKVRAGLDLLSEDPNAGKTLQGDLAGLRSLRVGQFRIVYRSASRRIIDIVTIGPRKSVYEQSARWALKDRSR